MWKKGTVAAMASFILAFSACDGKRMLSLWSKAPLSAFYNKNVEEYEYNIDKTGKPLGEAGWKKG